MNRLSLKTIINYCVIIKHVVIHVMNMTENNRCHHGIFRGRNFACEVARGLFWFGDGHRGRQEYSLHAKASPCPIFCFGGEEQACGTIRV